jgi:hypothetical protein
MNKNAKSLGERKKERHLQKIKIKVKWKKSEEKKK